MLPGGSEENPLAMGVTPHPPHVTLPLSLLRQVSVQNLERTRQTTFPVTVVAEVDATRLMAMHDSLKPYVQARLGIPFTYLPFFARATVRALQAYPIMNSTLTPMGHVIPRQINLGVATHVPGGVMIPTILNAERQGFWDLAMDLYQRTSRAKSGMITPAEMSGQTFLITNTGRWGGTLFGTPVIMSPNVGSLSFETIQKRPVVAENDQIVVRPMMYMALTADHRAVDGADMVSFIGKVKEILEKVQM